MIIFLLKNIKEFFLKNRIKIFKYLFFLFIIINMLPTISCCDSLSQGQETVQKTIDNNNFFTGVTLFTVPIIALVFVIQPIGGVCVLFSISGLTQILEKTGLLKSILNEMDTESLLGVIAERKSFFKKSEVELIDNLAAQSKGVAVIRVLVAALKKIPRKDDGTQVQEIANIFFERVDKITENCHPIMLEHLKNISTIYPTKVFTKIQPNLNVIIERLDQICINNAELIQQGGDIGTSIVS